MKFDHFVHLPKHMLGFGFDNCWMWVDAADAGDELVRNGVNCTSIDLFGCGPTCDVYPIKPIDPNRGYWMEPTRWPVVKLHLDTFMLEMWRRRITVIVTLSGWGFRGGCPDPANGGKPSTICSARFDSAWFANSVGYFIQRPIAKRGTVLIASAEPYGGKNTGCYSKFDTWTMILDSGWQDNMKGWNKGTTPRTAPQGYFVVYHPQRQADIPPRDAIALTDSPVGGTLVKPGPAETTTVDPAKLTPYFKMLRSRGIGPVYYGYPFNGWNIDRAGIRAVGEAGK